MSNQLIRYVNHDVPVPRGDREVARQAKQLYDEALLADFKVAGTYAVAAKAMHGAAELDNVRMQLAAGDPAMAAMLSSFQAVAFQQVHHIQRSVFNDFGC